MGAFDLNLDLGTGADVEVDVGAVGVGVVLSSCASRRSSLARRPWRKLVACVRVE